jgi:hypothetical protein
MIIKDQIVRFDENDNPTFNNLSEKAQALVSSDYKGTNTSETLARLYSAKLENGLSVAELSSVVLDEAPAENNNLVRTQIITKRLGNDVDVKRADFMSLFFSLSETLNFEDRENAFYLVELYNSLSSITNGTNIGATTRHLYSLKKGRDENQRIPIGEIRKYILLNKALRAEGIVLPATEVFYCSLAWSEGEIFNLIERGLSLSDALKMYEVGFKTIDEIVEFGGSVPTSWIDAILND